MNLAKRIEFVLSNRVRFRILLRDRFTCRYCGRSAPHVSLEIDHIVPTAKGGSDEDHNLGCACYGCNRGKRDLLIPSEVACQNCEELSAACPLHEDAAWTEEEKALARAWDETHPYPVT